MVCSTALAARQHLAFDGGRQEDAIAPHHRRGMTGGQRHLPGMLRSGCHSVGIPCSLETPWPPGPRHCGQFSAARPLTGGRRRRMRAWTADGHRRSSEMRRRDYRGPSRLARRVRVRATGTGDGPTSRRDERRRKQSAAGRRPTSEARVPGARFAISFNAAMKSRSARARPVPRPARARRRGRERRRLAGMAGPGPNRRLDRNRPAELVVARRREPRLEGALRRPLVAGRVRRSPLPPEHRRLRRDRCRSG